MHRSEGLLHRLELDVLRVTHRRCLQARLQRRQCGVVGLLLLVDLDLGLLELVELGAEFLEALVGLVVVAGLRRRLHVILHRSEGLLHRIELGVLRLAHRRCLQARLQRGQRGLVLLLLLVDLGLGLLEGVELGAQILELRVRLVVVAGLRRRLHRALRLRDLL